MGSFTPPKLLVILGPALLTGLFGKAFDIAFLSNNYVRIASELNHYKDATWMHVKASICSALFIPLHTHLLRLFRIRRAMLVAYFFFAVGTGLFGISTSYWQLLASRFIIGLGNSGISLFSMIVINEIVGIKQLALWESFVLCLEMGTSMAAGPVCGWISAKYTWHSVFYLEFIFAAIGFVVLYISFARLSSYPEFSESMLLKCVAVPIISLTLGDNFLEWSSPVEIELLISDLQRLRLSYLFLDLRPDFAKVASSMPYFERRKAM
ncbi:major facilitator superfamily domain-containing protein [Penicillium hetheringtonii]|uniref:Major facilitator superfamily domain-containing protein n=1 Tax=Penicillium hetheringtonii TaxID=911720 RepID=A0AAD6GQM6_9EURO|nr:major facilitator superfamily domain-containing protein [Penicillium hetheringtonii]